jgi:6-phosphogluconolactonase (cycloisomerase 2 family)
MTFHPNGRVLYNARAALNAFQVDGTTGALKPVSGSPFAGGGEADPNAIDVAIDPQGRFVYTVAFYDTAVESGTVTAYAVDATSGALHPVPGPPTLTPNAYSVAVDPGGRFVIVGNDDISSLTVFSIDQATGALSPVPSAPLAAPGLQPQIVALRAPGSSP